VDETEEVEEEPNTKGLLGAQREQSSDVEGKKQKLKLEQDPEVADLEPQSEDLEHGKCSTLRTSPWDGKLDEREGWHNRLRSAMFLGVY
jgi:hypothetical protein